MYAKTFLRHSSILWICLMLAVAVFGCDSESEPQSIEAQIGDVADRGGNLLIKNMTNNKFVLFRNEVAVRVVPAGARNFAVEVRAESATTGDVYRLFSYDDVGTDLAKPTVEPAHSWTLALDTAGATGATWWLDPETEPGTPSGELTLEYTVQTDYKVDVYKTDQGVSNCRNGSRVAVVPINGRVTVNFPYGGQFLCFAYWESGPMEGDSIPDYVGEVTTLVGADGERRPISVILDRDAPKQTLRIPAFQNTEGQVEYGTLVVQNQTSVAITIVTGSNQAIADVADERGPTEGRSDIRPGESKMYRLETRRYNLQALDFATGSPIVSFEAEIKADETTEWAVADE